MRRPVVALVSVVLGVSLTACGGRSEQNAAGGGIPTITKQADGTSGTASAPDGTAANHWCSLLQAGEGTTPDGKGRLPTGVTRVTFRLRDTGADVVCAIR